MKINGGFLARVSAATLFALGITACAGAPVARPKRAVADGLELGPGACAPGKHPSIDERSGQIDALRDVIERSLVRTAPNLSFPQGAARLFNGNLDWHSSVHAHWALLSIARVTRDAALEARLMARITPQALEEERHRLALTPPDPDRELPYGQAWLLLMLRELALRPVGRSPAAVALRAETEERVLAYLESHPFPEGRAANALKQVTADPGYYSRAHTSWLFGYFMLKLSQPSAARADRLSRLSERVEANREAVLRQTENGPWDFLSLPAVLWIADHAAPVHAPEWLYRAAPSAWPELPVTSKNAHQSGRVMVSLWPHAVQSGSGSRVSCEVFNSTLDQMMTHREYWSFDEKESSPAFATVGHWVPQFIWMGILLEQKENAALL